MSSLTIFLIFIPILAIILLGLNVIFATYNPDAEKTSPFECGFTSFSQTRSPFHVSFYLIGILFLIFDLEVALLYPYAVSAYNNDYYGL
jgi:NADH-ubiquinone oxidoreductase chain 3